MDKYYIITRYPNGLPGLTPAEYFEDAEALQAVEDAAKVLDFVKARLEGLREAE